MIHKGNNFAKLATTNKDHGIKSITFSAIYNSYTLTTQTLKKIS